MIALVAAETDPVALAARHLGAAIVAKIDGDFGKACAEARESFAQSVRSDHAVPLLGNWANRELVGLLVLTGDIPGAFGQARSAQSAFAHYVVPSGVCSLLYALALLNYLAGDIKMALHNISGGVTLARQCAMPRALWPKPNRPARHRSRASPR
jgi:hypothetical protein